MDANTLGIIIRADVALALKRITDRKARTQLTRIGRQSNIGSMRKMEALMDRGWNITREYPTCWGLFE